MTYTIVPIATARSPYKQKFGIARQPGLVSAAEVCIELNPEFTADSVRGLEDFDYVWISFIFHGVLDEGWAQMVRPPRLGGKQKMGVFATRSPHRPNHLGLSLLKLNRIETGKPVRLYCSGADLLDGTPIVDIKPYIPFVESKPDAASGFVSGKPVELEVVWQEKHRRGKFICKHQKPYQPKHCPRSAPRLSEYSRTDLCDEYCGLRNQISNRGKPCNRY